MAGKRFSRAFLRKVKERLPGRRGLYDAVEKNNRPWVVTVLKNLARDSETAESARVLLEEIGEAVEA